MTPKKQKKKKGATQGSTGGTATKNRTDVVGEARNVNFLKWRKGLRVRGLKLTGEEGLSSGESSNHGRRGKGRSNIQKILEPCGPEAHENLL